MHRRSRDDKFSYRQEMQCLSTARLTRNVAGFAGAGACQVRRSIRTLGRLSSGFLANMRVVFVSGPAQAAAGRRAKVKQDAGAVMAETRSSLNTPDAAWSREI